MSLVFAVKRSTDEVCAVWGETRKQDEIKYRKDKCETLKMKMETMKKIYQTPCISVSTIRTTHMLATSFDKYETGSTGGVLTREKDNKKGGGIGGGLWSDMQ